MPVTVSLLIMGSNSPLLTITMIMLRNVVPVLRHMVEDGGSTGQESKDEYYYHYSDRAIVIFS